MLKLVGSMLLMGGAAGLGFGAAAQLRARADGLRALLAALEHMERELAFQLTAMPELLDRVAREARMPAALFFARCRAGLSRLGEKSLGQLWQEALEEETDLLLTDEEGQILRNLGDVLGRYDSEAQRTALRGAINALGEALRCAREERDRMGRVYSALGLGAGAMLVILLL